MIKAKAEALRAFRIERGWDMTKLAHEAKVTQATISRVERGNSTSPSTAKKGSRCTRPTRRRAVHHIVREAAA